MSKIGTRARREIAVQNKTLSEVLAHARWALDNVTLDTDARKQLAEKIARATFPEETP
jgi:hypothetical protein